MAEPSNSDCNSDVQEENNAVVEEEEALTSINNENRGIESYDDDDDDGPPTHQVGHKQSKVTAPAVLSSKLETIDDDDGPPTHHINDGSEEKRNVISSQLEMIDDDDGPPTHHVEDDSHEKRKVTAAAVITSRLEMIDDDDGPPTYQIEDDSHEKRKATAAAVLSSQLETIEDDDGPPTYHFDDDADQKRAAISSFSTIVEPNPPTSIVEADRIQAKIAAYRTANEEKCEEGCDMSDDESISYEQSTINTTSNHTDEQGTITLNASVLVDENDEEEDIEYGIQRESSQPQAIAGFLVGEEDDHVVEGVAETILPWWKQRRGKILITVSCTFLPILVLIGFIIYYSVRGKYYRYHTRNLEVILFFLSLGMFIFCSCWNFGQQCRLKCCSYREPVMDLGEEDQKTVHSNPEVNASIRSSINRETSISARVAPIIPEACMVEEVDEEVDIAGVAEPIPPWWEQRQGKTIIRSIFLISTIYLLVMVPLVVLFYSPLMLTLFCIAAIIFSCVLCTYTKGCSCKVSTERMAEE